MEKSGLPKEKFLREEAALVKKRCWCVGEESGKAKSQQWKRNQEKGAVSAFVKAFSR